MGGGRREFIRRIAAGSGLLAVGVLGAWGLVQKSLGGGTGQAPQTLPSPNGAAGQGVASTETVTVTEYASGSGAQSSQAASSASQSVPGGYFLVTPLSALAGRTSAYFNHPTRGLSILVSLSSGWHAFSAVCTHAGCTVQYTGTTILCPCHNGTFNPANGAVTGGPPPAPLPEMTVLVSNGDLYVSG
ncbi:MAG: Rieske (2Fe-2S) protein [Nitrososphaerota archaeon]|nr:Rieske (2Fe-2S) protein [Nitrososphaerota archaeon]